MSQATSALSAPLQWKRAGSGRSSSATTGPRSNELRLAAIDVGSNSIHMLVAQVDASSGAGGNGSDRPAIGGLTTLWRAKEMVGLGRLSFPSHRLSRIAMDRAVAALSRFLVEARRYQCEEVIAVATSAVREADNGGEFIQRVRRELGVHVRVVSARDEARLIYLGARHAMDLKGGPHLILDIGGGSVEFVVATQQRPLLLESRKLGSARMTAKFLKSDPVAPEEVRALLRHYDVELSDVLNQVQTFSLERIIGTSGTIENLAALCRLTDTEADGERESTPAGEEELPPLRRAALDRLVERLLKSRAAERVAMPGLDQKRQDQIVAGAVLAAEIMRRLDARQLEVCRSALREGLLVDHLARHWPEVQIRREIADPRRRSVLDLGRRCHWQREHCEQVARLCLRLFDQLKRVHKLGRAARELIEYGALLHDVGAMIGPQSHHKHSLYLILNGGLQGFEAWEIAVIANIARYHRKAMPSRSHPEFGKLSKAHRRIVEVGASLLRIADGLDRTNGSVVESLRCRAARQILEVTIEARGDAELEVWSARARADMFERLFELPVRLRCRERRAT
jgi:exopolyphosphatase/guanosine-5'-triphosphate,3'-diphosphate pyrophosphatase